MQNKDGKFLFGSKSYFYPKNIYRLQGGGINPDEHPLIATQREIEEELKINTILEEYTGLCEIETIAQTSVGEMRMTTFVYRLNSGDQKYIPSDDISSVAEINTQEFEDFIKRFENLNGTYFGGGFSFDWIEYGKIYAPIHRLAFVEFEQLK